MGWFSSWFKKEDWFTPQERERIVAAVRAAEKRTSGEIRIFIESRCSYVDPIDRAAEIFFGLKMQQTEDRNAVLLYIAMKDHQLAVYGDQGIHEKVGSAFWSAEVKQICSEFRSAQLTEGMIHMVTDIGEALVQHFPYHNEDRNELPDDIVFGR